MHCCRCCAVLFGLLLLLRSVVSVAAEPSVQMHFVLTLHTGCSFGSTCSFVKGLEERDMARAQLGLAHSYSRAKVKFNVNKADNMIIQVGLLSALGLVNRWTGLVDCGELQSQVQREERRTT